jgi:hypothetical protein
MKHCTGCGDDFPSDMVFNALRDEAYCAHCLNVDEMDEKALNYLKDKSPLFIDELFWSTVYGGHNEK